MLILIPLLSMTSLLLHCHASVTNPAIISWMPTTGINSVYNVHDNVWKVEYSATYAYVSTNSIPSHTMGPWKANPNDASGQGYTFKIPLSITQATSHETVGLGTVGVWKNGVSIYSPEDGRSYNNRGVWFRNAYVFEAISFDSCKGHPQLQGVYHYHINPICLYSYQDSSVHSPILGYMFDGVPVYGSYGYSSANDSSSAIVRILSSYQTNSALSSSGRTGGPSVDSSYPLGSFIQDYIYTQGLGHLDEYNGRWGVTPEYPNGVYAYFATIESDYTPAYPYIVGPKYYGVVTDQGRYKITPTEDVTILFSNADSLLKKGIFLRIFLITIPITLMF